MSTATKPLESARPLTRLLGVQLPYECLVHNDNARSRELIERIQSEGINLELFRHDDADEDALPVLKIGDNEMGPSHPSVDNWLTFLAIEAQRDKSDSS